MSEMESQFILAAYRPNGCDEADPAMSAALEKVRRNPGLQSAFQAQVAFDSSIAAAIASIPIPGNLRSDILAGARLSEANGIGASPGTSSAKSRRHSRPRAWIPLAAAAALLVSTGVLVFNRGTDAGPPPWHDEALTLIDSVGLGSGSDHGGGFDLAGADAPKTRGWLQNEMGADVVIPASLKSLPSAGCKCIPAGDGRIALVCFDAGDGSLVHFAVYDAAEHEDGDLPGSPADAPLNSSENGRWEYASWKEGSRQYLLAAAMNNPDARKRLRELLEIRA